MSYFTIQPNNHSTKARSDPAQKQNEKKYSRPSVTKFAADHQPVNKFINTPSCSRLNFTTIDNDGCDGRQSLSCFWISIAQLMQLTKQTIDPNIPTPSPIQLRQTMNFPDGSIMFDINSSDIYENKGHSAILQELCDRYNLSISIYYVNNIGDFRSCWIGQPAITIVDSKRSVHKSHHFSLANFEAHFEPIVSQTPTSKEISASFLNGFTLKYFRYIPEVSTSICEAAAKPVVKPIVKPIVPSSVHRDQLSGVTIERDAIAAYIHSCETDLSNLLSTSSSDYFPGLPKEIIMLHQQKIKAQILTIETTLDSSRALLEVYNLQITELA